jgi:hypothetical protein
MFLFRVRDRVEESNGRYFQQFDSVSDAEIFFTKSLCRIFAMCTYQNIYEILKTAYSIQSSIFHIYIYIYIYIYIINCVII